MKCRILETYNNAVMPHGHHVHKTPVAMAMTLMFPFTPNQNSLHHCKCVFWCCFNCPSIVIRGQEYSEDDTNMCSKIFFISIDC